MPRETTSRNAVAVVATSGAAEADPYLAALGIPQPHLPEHVAWLEEADDALRFMDLPDFDIPEDPGVPENELPQDPFGEFYLLLELEHLAGNTGLDRGDCASS